MIISSSDIARPSLGLGQLDATSGNKACASPDRLAKLSLLRSIALNRSIIIPAIAAQASVRQRYPGQANRDAVQCYRSAL